MATAAATFTNAHGTVILRRAARVLLGCGLVAFLFLVYEFVLTPLSFEQAQLGLLEAFKHDIQTTVLGAPTVAAAEGAPVSLLRIPRIGLERVVVEGTSAQDLKTAPGHLSVSPLPGEAGNAVIISRRATHGGPFWALGTLKSGDEIRVTTGQGTFGYRVTEVRHVSAGDPGPLTGTLDSRLTLVTSDPALFGTGRLLVVARLDGAPVGVAQRVAPPAVGGALGMAGDPLWFGPTLLWAQFLVGARWLTWRLRHQWPPSVLFLFAMPVLLGLAVLTFSSFDRVLPGAV